MRALPFAFAPAGFSFVLLFAGEFNTFSLKPADKQKSL